MASSSPTPSTCSETLSNSCPSVFVSNDLMQLIKDPAENGEKGPPSSPINVQLTTMDDLLMHVKNYIVKHKLYDPANPVKILVHETELGSLLGKSEFSLLDVRDLLQKFVYPVEAKNSSEVCSIREKMCVVPKKRGKFDNLFDSEFSAKRIKGVVDYTTTSDESMHSIQDYETEYVKDSTPPPLSDDNFSVNGLIFAESFDVDVEYEIETRTDNSDFSCESDSDIEDMVKNAIITFIAKSSDSELEYLADRSSDEQSEQEISEKDKWRCRSCLTLNDPRMRCCEACWLTRVGWLSEERQKCDQRDRKQKGPARSKRKLSKRLNKNKKNNKGDSSNNKFSNLPSVTTESLSTDVFQSPSNTHEAPDKESTKKTELDQQLCLFCCAKPADSSIIHGKIGCRICCFKCGKRLYESNQRCPACRRQIERVVYLFNA